MSDPIAAPMALVPLPDLAERAQRLADGQTVNREKLARDVDSLIREVTFWRERHAATVAEAKPGGFSEAFKDFFEGFGR